MISFLWRKMWKNKWMMLSLLIGNILLVGIVAGTPMYVNATLRRVLHQELRQHQMETNVHPTMLELRYTFNNIAEENRMIGYDQTRLTFAPGLLDDIGVPAMATLRTDVLSNWHIVPSPPREDSPRIRTFQLTGVENMPENVELLLGRMPDNTLRDGNVLEAIATEATLMRHDVILGEMLEVRNVDAHPSGTLYVQIVGVYTFAEGSDMFWTSLGFNHVNALLVSNELIRNEFLANYHEDYRLSTTWIHLLDFTQMTSRNVPQYLESLADMREMFAGTNAIWHFSENFSSAIAGHTGEAGRLEITLWVLQIPIYVLLAAYIYIISRQILKMDQNDIAVIASRGASRGQLLIIYALQGVFVTAVCYPLGIFLGVQICRVLGASNGFLELVQRAVLFVEITPQALLYAGAAMIISFLMMLIPVIKFSRISIVGHKRGDNTKTKKPLWQRFFLDILCLGVAGYALYAFNLQGHMLAGAAQDAPSVDPLIFASSSLFILGLGLFVLRLFPYAVKILFLVGRKFWSPTVYASLLKVMRSAEEEQFIMMFLIFTLSIGTFNAQTARTLNLNNDHQIQYLAGADLMFREFWRSDAPMEVVMGGVQAPELIVFHEPNFSRFTNFAEVDAITQVKQQAVTLRHQGESIFGTTLMGIDTYTFGRTAWFRDDLLDVHINHFLNALASNPEGVLVSENLRAMGYGLGDWVNFVNDIGNTARGQIVGFVEHWPNFAGGRLIIANLGFLQTSWGVQPYQVWMRTNTASNRFFHEFMAQERLDMVEFYDAKAAVVESRINPMLQGINGVLTVGFIVTLLVCFTGFLIYWVLSIRSRVLQFGIFRAMGMQMRELVRMLINEQVLVTLTAIVLGAAVGEIAARLFVPLVQASYAGNEQVIPILVVSELSDYRNLYIVIGTMVVICLAVLGVYVSKIKIAQALKLGED